MVWILFLGVLLIIAILAYLSLYRRNKSDFGTRPQDKKMGPHKIDPRPGPKSHVTDSQIAPENVVDDKGLLIPEFKRSDQTVERKNRIQEGVEFLFSTKPGIVVEPKKTLRLEDVDPKVMKAVVRLPSSQGRR